VTLNKKKTYNKCHRTRQAGEGNYKKRTHKKWDAGGEGGWRGGRCLPFINKSYITQEQTKNKHATQYMGTSKHRGKPWYPKRALPLPLPLRIERTANENTMQPMFLLHAATVMVRASRSGYFVCGFFYLFHPRNQHSRIIYTCFKQPRLAILGVAHAWKSEASNYARPDQSSSMLQTIGCLGF
jgi:hypothetical protein